MGNEESKNQLDQVESLDIQFEEVNFTCCDEQTTASLAKVKRQIPERSDSVSKNKNEFRISHSPNHQSVQKNKESQPDTLTSEYPKTFKSPQDLSTDKLKLCHASKKMSTLQTIVADPTTSPFFHRKPVNDQIYLDLSLKGRDVQVGKRFPPINETQTLKLKKQADVGTTNAVNCESNQQVKQSSRNAIEAFPAPPVFEELMGLDLSHLNPEERVAILQVAARAKEVEELESKKVRPGIKHSAVKNSGTASSKLIRQTAEGQDSAGLADKLKSGIQLKENTGASPSSSKGRETSTSAKKQINDKTINGEKNLINNNGESRDDLILRNQDAANNEIAVREKICALCSNVIFASSVRKQEGKSQPGELFTKVENVTHFTCASCATDICKSCCTSSVLAKKGEFLCNLCLKQRELAARSNVWLKGATRNNIYRSASEDLTKRKLTRQSNRPDKKKKSLPERHQRRRTFTASLSENDAEDDDEELEQMSISEILVSRLSLDKSVQEEIKKMSKKKDQICSVAESKNLTNALEGKSSANCIINNTLPAGVVASDMLKEPNEPSNNILFLQDASESNEENTLIPVATRKNKPLAPYILELKQRFESNDSTNYRNLEKLSNHSYRDINCKKNDQKLQNNNELNKLNNSRSLNLKNININSVTITPSASINEPSLDDLLPMKQFVNDSGSGEVSISQPLSTFCASSEHKEREDINQTSSDILSCDKVAVESKENKSSLTLSINNTLFEQNLPKSFVNANIEAQTAAQITTVDNNSTSDAQTNAPISYKDEKQTKVEEDYTESKEESEIFTKKKNLPEALFFPERNLSSSAKERHDSQITPSFDSSCGESEGPAEWSMDELDDGDTFFLVTSSGTKTGNIPAGITIPSTLRSAVFDQEIRKSTEKAGPSCNDLYEIKDDHYFIDDENDTEGDFDHLFEGKTDIDLFSLKGMKRASPFCDLSSMTERPIKVDATENDINLNKKGVKSSDRKTEMNNNFNTIEANFAEQTSKNLPIIDKLQKEENIIPTETKQMVKISSKENTQVKHSSHFDIRNNIMSPGQSFFKTTNCDIDFSDSEMQNTTDASVISCNEGLLKDQPCFSSVASNDTSINKPIPAKRSLKISQAIPKIVISNTSEPIQAIAHRQNVHINENYNITNGGQFTAENVSKENSFSPESFCSKETSAKEYDEKNQNKPITFNRSLYINRIEPKHSQSVVRSDANLPLSPLVTSEDNGNILKKSKRLQATEVANSDAKTKVYALHSGSYFECDSNSSYSDSEEEEHNLLQSATSSVPIHPEEMEEYHTQTGQNDTEKSSKLFFRRTASTDNFEKLLMQTTETPRPGRFQQIPSGFAQKKPKSTYEYSKIQHQKQKSTSCIRSASYSPPNDMLESEDSRRKSEPFVLANLPQRGQSASHINSNKSTATNQQSGDSTVKSKKESIVTIVKDPKHSSFNLSTSVSDFSKHMEYTSLVRCRSCSPLSNADNSKANVKPLSISSTSYTVKTAPPKTLKYNTSKSVNSSTQVTPEKETAPSVASIDLCQLTSLIEALKGACDFTLPERKLVSSTPDNISKISASKVTMSSQAESTTNVLLETKEQHMVDGKSPAVINEPRSTWQKDSLCEAVNAKTCLPGAPEFLSHDQVIYSPSYGKLELDRERQRLHQQYKNTADVRVDAHYNYANMPTYYGAYPNKNISPYIQMHRRPVDCHLSSYEYTGIPNELNFENRLGFIHATSPYEVMPQMNVQPMSWHNHSYRPRNMSMEHFNANMFPRGRYADRPVFPHCSLPHNQFLRQKRECNYNSEFDIEFDQHLPEDYNLCHAERLYSASPLLSRSSRETQANPHYMEYEDACKEKEDGEIAQGDMIKSRFKYDRTRESQRRRRQAENYYPYVENLNEPLHNHFNLRRSASVPAVARTDEEASETLASHRQSSMARRKHTTSITDHLPESNEDYSSKQEHLRRCQKISTARENYEVAENIVRCPTASSTGTSSSSAMYFLSPPMSPTQECNNLKTYTHKNPSNIDCHMDFTTANSEIGIVLPKSSGTGKQNFQSTENRNILQYDNYSLKRQLPDPPSEDEYRWSYNHRRNNSLSRETYFTGKLDRKLGQETTRFRQTMEDLDQEERELDLRLRYLELGRSSKASSLSLLADSNYATTPFPKYSKNNEFLHHSNTPTKTCNELRNNNNHSNDEKGKTVNLSPTTENNKTDPQLLSENLRKQGYDAVADSTKFVKYGWLQNKEDDADGNERKRKKDVDAKTRPSHSYTRNNPVRSVAKNCSKNIYADHNHSNPSCHTKNCKVSCCRNHAMSKHDARSYYPNACDRIKTNGILPSGSRSQLAGDHKHSSQMCCFNDSREPHHHSQTKKCHSKRNAKGSNLHRENRCLEEISSRPYISRNSGTSYSSLNHSSHPSPQNQIQRINYFLQYPTDISVQNKNNENGHFHRASANKRTHNTRDSSGWIYNEMQKPSNKEKNVMKADSDKCDSQLNSNVRCEKNEYIRTTPSYNAIQSYNKLVERNERHHQSQVTDSRDHTFYPDDVRTTVSDTEAYNLRDEISDWYEKPTDLVHEETTAYAEFSDCSKE